MNQIYPIEKLADSYRDKLGISYSDIVFLYSENMGEKQGLEIIVESARQLINKKNIVFVISGYGTSYNFLFNLAKGLSNIHWLPLQPLEKLNELLNLADVRLLPQKAMVEDLVMPSKLTGMLASGRPVLATANKQTQIAKVLKNSGVIVPPENSNLLSEAITALADDSELRKVLGQNARDYAVKYLEKNIVLGRFEDKHS